MIIFRGSREKIEDFAGNDFYSVWCTFIREFNRYHHGKNVPSKLLVSAKIIRGSILETTTRAPSPKVKKKLTGLAELLQQINLDLTDLKNTIGEVEFSIRKKKIEKEIIKARALIILLGRRLKNPTQKQQQRNLENNSALIVVHPEKAYLDEDIAHYGEALVIETRHLFTNIATEIELSLSEGKKVYYLAEISTSADSPTIFPAIKKHLPKLIFVPFGASLENQLLRVKKILLESGIGTVEICGVMREICVKELYDLLRGHFDRRSRNEYEVQGQRLGWDKEKVASILKTKIDASILEELSY